MNADLAHDTVHMFHARAQGYYDTYYEKCVELGFKPKTIGECTYNVVLH